MRKLLSCFLSVGLMLSSVGVVCNAEKPDSQQETAVNPEVTAADSATSESQTSGSWLSRCNNWFQSLISRWSPLGVDFSRQMQDGLGADHNLRALLEGCSTEVPGVPAQTVPYAQESLVTQHTPPEMPAVQAEMVLDVPEAVVPLVTEHTTPVALTLDEIWAAANPRDTVDEARAATDHTRHDELPNRNVVPQDWRTDPRNEILPFAPTFDELWDAAHSRAAVEAARAAGRMVSDKWTADQERFWTSEAAWGNGVPCLGWRMLFDVYNDVWPDALTLARLYGDGGYKRSDEMAPSWASRGFDGDGVFDAD